MRRIANVALGASVVGVALAIAALPPNPACAQQLTKVRYAEVVRTIFYLPKYAALQKGFFKEEGLEIEMTTAGGGDRGTAMLLGNQIDIALQGPETLIFVANSESPEKLKMFSAITATDGLFLLSREKVPAAAFRWNMLKGKRVMGWRPGSTPELFLEHVLKKNGIDIAKDITLITNIAIPARNGAWQANQADFGIFTEPDPSRMEAEGQGTIVASIGKETGAADYTGFQALEGYIRKNPEIVQRFTNAVYKGQKWVATADPLEAARLVAPYFPGVSPELLAVSIKRLREHNLIKTDPVTTREAYNRLQDIMVEGGVVKPDKKVAYDRVVLTSFAEKAKATIR